MSAAAWILVPLGLCCQRDSYVSGTKPLQRQSRRRNSQADSDGQDSELICPSRRNTAARNSAAALTLSPPTRRLDACRTQRGWRRGTTPTVTVLHVARAPPVTFKLVPRAALAQFGLPVRTRVTVDPDGLAQSNSKYLRPGSVVLSRFKPKFPLQHRHCRYLTPALAHTTMTSIPNARPARQQASSHRFHGVDYTSRGLLYSPPTSRAGPAY